ncbi:hypothetical protein HID58_078594 [Brassica napus]|uniref:Lysine ketoglutarate reductase n=1 Tax=Brassica napus TaxID=3708 RepID=A0ABQ7YUI5_BRANA|nr:hypothetical protein HID58_078594 [Brassica napus]
MNMNSSGDEEKLGNGVVGILAESVNKWERRTPLTPSHCARLLHGGKDRTGVSRIVVQPSGKRIHHDALYEDVGCEISDDLSDCGLILGIKQPKLEMILPERAYAFFSHTHKAQEENMPLLDKILSERVTLYDYELIVGDHGRRLLAFGKYAGRAGLVDFLHGLGKRYLGLGYSTPFLSVGSSYMYSSLAAAKAAVISVGEEIASQGLPSGICPLVFVFTGTGNVSLGAQEIFKLLPHTFVEPSQLPELFLKDNGISQNGKSTKRVHQVYGCIITSQDMVEHQDPSKSFDKADYYAHPEHYNPVFHEKIAPYTSVLVNCMYWEKKFPRLLSTKQIQDLSAKGCPLVGICDITCDIGGSIEFVNRATSIDSPFFRFDPAKNSYCHDMDGDGVICMAVDILPTEFAKEASQHFGDILSEFVGSLASMTEAADLPGHLKRACISYKGELTPLYEYIPRMRKSDPHVDEEMKKKKLGNRVVGILAESVNKWERRTPLTPSHCSRLLQDRTGVSRIVVQPSAKRIYHDALYADVGCEISDDLSDCGLILCIKQPKGTETKKMPLLDKILSERVTLYDYELIVGDHGKRLLAFGVDEFNFRCRISKSRILNSFPVARFILYGLPSGICPLVFVFTGTGNVSLGAQEIFKLLPHTFVEPSNLPELFVKDKGMGQTGKSTKRVHQVYGCIITSQDMVEHQDPSKSFDKADYYAHPEHYNPVFHDKIAPYTSVLEKGCPLVGICDITCDIGGSVEFVNRATSIDSPFFRFNPIKKSYYNDMDGDGVLRMAIDILPTEFAKEASQHFGDILSEFVGSLASMTEVADLPGHLKRACISHRGELTPLYEHIPQMYKITSPTLLVNPDEEDYISPGGETKEETNK